MAQLMTPLFEAHGNFNRGGKKIRANYCKTVGAFPLWTRDSKPDLDYTSDDNNKYYLHVEKNGYIFNIGETEYSLSARAGYEYMLKQWYGDFDGREKYFKEHFYKGRKYLDAHELVVEQVAKESEFIGEWGNNEQVQVAYIQALIDGAIQRYIRARDDGGTFPDFVGALFLNELDKCIELSKIRMERLHEEYIEREKQQAAVDAERDRREAKEERARIDAAETAFINGGDIEGGRIIVTLADKHGVTIPIRTRGWILNNLSQTSISEHGSISYRWWKRGKGARDSQTAYSVLRDIRSAIVGI